jgi:hypothetical protein
MFSRTLIVISLLVAAVAAGFGEESEDIPDAASFRPFLIRDLTKYFAQQYGDGIGVDYQLFRDGPTITGVAYPKYYMWVTVSDAGKTRVEGAARVAAIQKHFEVTDFIFREVIQKRPELLERAFPKGLISTIRDKASIDQ